MKLLDYLQGQRTPDPPKKVEPYKGVHLCFLCNGTLKYHEPDCPRLKGFKP